MECTQVQRTDQQMARAAVPSTTEVVVLAVVVIYVELSFDGWPVK